MAKEGQGNLRFPGTVLDMTADSAKYIKLQKDIYRDKAKEEAAAVGNHVPKLLQSIVQAPKSREFQRKNYNYSAAILFLWAVRCQSLAEEYGLNAVNRDEIISSMDNLDNEMIFYLMLWVVDRFHKQHGRYPGV